MKKHGRSHAKPLGGRPARPRLYLNGKFYSGRMNGVNRSADRLLRALDECAVAGEEASGWDIRLLLPRDAENVPAFSAIQTIHRKMRGSQIWEQAILPFLAWDGILLNLANFAPLLHPRKVTLVHDAQFRISPQSYSLRRRIGYRAIIPVGARSSRKVLTVSDYARDSLEIFGFAQRSDIAVIGNGGEHIHETRADTTVLDQLMLRRRPFALAFGSPAIYKNLQVVFEAFKHDDLTDIDLVIVGSSRTALLDAGLSTPRHAIFTGAIDDGALRALYETALCLLFPSRTEGFGLPPLEAMRCGCPVIAAPAGAMPEICQDAILYAGVDTPEDWAAQILRLTGTSYLRRSKIAHGLIRAEAYSWLSSARALAANLAPLLKASIQETVSTGAKASGDFHSPSEPAVSIPHAS